jgi:protein transport protein SEC31
MTLLVRLHILQIALHSEI